MIKKEQLEKVSTLSVVNKSQGVLSTLEAKRFLDKYNKLIVCKSRERKVFCFVDDHEFGKGVMPKDFTTLTAVLPTEVTPTRNCFVNRIYDVETYMQYFHREWEQLDTVKDLVDAMNSPLPVKEDKQFVLPQAKGLYARHIPA